MSDPRADVALLVDFTDLRHSMCPEHRGKPPAPPEGEPEAAVEATDLPGDAPGGAAEPTAADVARHLMRFARSLGRVVLARAYADWARCGPLAQEVHSQSLEPVLVPCTRDGEDRSHVRLVVDALESLFCGDEPDAFVLVTGDPTLLPLVQRLRADGADVLVLAPSHAVSEELRAAADAYYPLEEVLGGLEPDAVQPRTWRGPKSSSAAAAADGEARPATPARTRERTPHPTPVTSEGGFDGYDWGPFIRLIDELEHRLPFVGVRYLVNKVLGLHNCGVDDPRLKRDLINRAVEDELIEMYPVGNVGDRADPVTACRLSRGSVHVVAVIGETTIPSGPPEDGGEDGGEDDGEDGEGIEDPQDGEDREDGEL